MKIKWLGHSCFLITSKEGTRILMDPFDSKVGYAVPEVEADIVTTSHNHYDHNYVQAARGRYRHIFEAGTFRHNDVEIVGIPVFHDEVQGAKRGKNIIYIFAMEGMRLCHCGDLGHIPAREQTGEIGCIDILLVPVGGTYTVDAGEAVEVMKLLKPKVTIPMHYKTSALSFPLDGVDKFLAAAGADKKKALLNRQQLEVSSQSLDELPDIVVPDYQ